MQERPALTRDPAEVTQLCLQSLGAGSRPVHFQTDKQDCRHDQHITTVNALLWSAAAKRES
jgi:hypothetical protein